MPLSLSMVGMMLANPVTISRVLLQVGAWVLCGWVFGAGREVSREGPGGDLMRPPAPPGPPRSVGRCQCRCQRCTSP